MSNRDTLSCNRTICHNDFARKSHRGHSKNHRSFAYLFFAIAKVKNTVIIDQTEQLSKAVALTVKSVVPTDKYRVSPDVGHEL